MWTAEVEGEEVERKRRAEEEEEGLYDSLSGGGNVRTGVRYRRTRWCRVCVCRGLARGVMHLLKQLRFKQRSGGRVGQKTPTKYMQSWDGVEWLTVVGLHQADVVRFLPYLRVVEML